MKHTWIAVAAMAAIAAGCGTQADPRLAVNDALRAKCSDFTDDELEAWLDVAEEDRLAGVPVSTHILAIPDGCTGLTISFEACETCSLAIINQVYGL